MTFVGTGSWRALAGRGFPSLRLDAGGVSLLVDCGDGALDRLLAGGGIGLDVVLLTSTAAVSISGLLMLAESFRSDRQKPLRVAGPPGTIDRVGRLATLAGVPDGLFALEELAPGDALADVGGLHVEAVRTDSPGSECLSYLVLEPSIPGRFNTAAAAKRGIQGRDFQLLAAGETVRGVRPDDVIGPRRLGRRIFVNGRGRATSDMADALEGADVAVFAAPFMDERFELAAELGYMTGWEAAHLAAEQRVRTVMLYQLTPSAPVGMHVAEARQFHASVHAPRAGQVLKVPLPENGAASLTSNRPTQHAQVRRPGPRR